MMKYYLDNILNELIKDDRICNIEGFAKDYNRKVYINSGEYQEYSIDLVFLVDTGDWFKKTISFTIITNSFLSKIEVVQHFNSNKTFFNRIPIENVTDYVINEILEFKNQNEKTLRRAM